MKLTTHQDPAQAMQRVRVGLTGLAMVLVLIGLATFIFSSASRDEPVVAIGAPNAEVVANLAEGAGANVAQAKGRDEPLAAVGAAPSTTSNDPDAAEKARRQQEQQQQ